MPERQASADSVIEVQDDRIRKARVAKLDHLAPGGFRQVILGRVHESSSGIDAAESMPLRHHYQSMRQLTLRGHRDRSSAKSKHPASVSRT